MFRRSDPRAATPIFEHSKTRKLRRSDKNAEEAVAVSAHLFVHLNKIVDAAHPSYHAILEEVPSLSRTFINNLISDVLRGTKYKFLDRHNEEKETYTLLDFHGVKSEKFGTALKQSSVPYVTLVRPGSWMLLRTSPIRGLSDSILIP